MRMYDIILKKRNGYSLSKEEIDFFVQGYTEGNIPDEQASALMMAVYFSGMGDEETAYLTASMAASGDTLDLSELGAVTVDKHSTGGVGDKTSLIVGPIVAALGCKVSKMSGRGLGHTGGTVDKLESIPGYCTTLSPEAFINQVKKIGIAVIAQTGNLAPADKKLYALRDVTATVDSIPLITSSIMSKKLAAGSNNIVLDVKFGSGAFMKDIDSARSLAQGMVSIGKKCGRKVSALITSMDCPLGNAIGNSMEIVEAIRVLKGEQKGDLYEVCVALATQMVSLALSLDERDAELRVKQVLESGAAFMKMKEWIAAQGGDVAYIDNPDKFPKADHCIEAYAPTDGFVERIDAEAIGSLCVRLGAGRSVKDESIDHSAGVFLYKKTGDYVQNGEVLCALYTNISGQDGLAVEAQNAFFLKSEKPKIEKLVAEKING